MYRQERNYENLNRRIFDGVGAFDIPALQPQSAVNVKSIIGFNYAKTCKDPYCKGLHFFVDDYQFTRLWTNPDAYLELMQKYKFVFTPDFSTYTDFPKIVQIYNHYRKHWLGAYWQENGVNVIPTVSWSTPDSYEWCFDGEPVGGAVAVSSVGTQSNERTKLRFLHGYKEMLSRLKPSAVYFYGIVPDACEGNIISIAAFQEKFRHKTGG